MIRVVAQHSPNVYAIVGLFDEENLTPTVQLEGVTYYRAETHVHFVLYKAAISGWGSKHDHGGTMMPDPRQR